MSAPLLSSEELGKTPLRTNLVCRGAQHDGAAVPEGSLGRCWFARHCVIGCWGNKVLVAVLCESKEQSCARPTVIEGFTLS